jgi:tripartite-type tricarboxylate transporter receptor subunit TctC
MKRRALLKAAASMPLSVTFPAVLRAQDSKTLRIVVPNAPGGTSDLLARLISRPFGEILGRTVVVDNRAGAGGNIGAGVVANSAPDGSNLVLMDVSTLATNPALFPSLSFDSSKDLAPVSMFIYAPYILAVNNALPVTDAASFEAYARQNAGKLNAGNAGNGTLSHLTLVSLAAGLNSPMAHVPYRGGAPSLTALAGNEINLTVAGATQSMPFVLQKQIRGIAVTGPRRLPQLPDLPTFEEMKWPSAQAGTWQGVLASGKTPPETLAKLEDALRKTAAQPAVAERIAQLGAEPRIEGPEAFRKWLAQETETLGKLIRDNKITAE